MYVTSSLSYFSALIRTLFDFLERRNVLIISGKVWSFFGPFKWQSSVLIQSTYIWVGYLGPVLPVVDRVVRRVAPQDCDSLWGRVLIIATMCFPYIFLPI